VSILTAPDPYRTPPTFCSVAGWCGSNANFVAIWGSSATDIWIVANQAGDVAGADLPTDSDERSALLHWDGVAWNAVQFEGTHALHSVWGTAKDDVWVVGASAFVRHFDGKTWSALPLSIGAPIDFTSVSGTSSRDVWAVGWGQTVRHFDGAAWSAEQPPQWDTFRSVWASANEVWVLGDKTLSRFDRTVWSTVGRPPDSVTSSVWGRAPGEAWVAGPAGSLERWDSNGEQTNRVPDDSSPANFRCVWGSSDRDGWAVGEKGRIAHFSDGKWSAGPHLTESNLNAAWGAQGRTWFVGDNGAFLEFDGKNFSASPIATHELNRLWGTSANDVWAAGREIEHWDGKLWQDVPRPGFREVLALWGSSESNVWAVGAQGLLLHWDGAMWRDEPSPTAADIQGVWGSGERDVWAVDADGRFLRFDGVQWSVWPADNFGPLQSVWGTNALDVVAVGGSNRIHFNGFQWSLLPSHPSETPTYNVAFGNGSLVWIGGHVAWSAYKAGGARPELGRWNGIGMTDNLEPTTAPSNITLTSSSIEAGWASDAKDVWIYLSRLMHWDGADWAYSAAGNARVRALWGTTRDVWALANDGQIMRKAR
jgi:hypothetical protein